MMIEKTLHNVGVMIMHILGGPKIGETSNTPYIQIVITDTYVYKLDLN